MKCQVCDNEKLERIISLGYMPPVNWMKPVGSELHGAVWMPTDLMRCPRCELVQLGFIPGQEWTFPPHYPYTSGSTRLLVDNFAQQADEAITRLRLQPGELVIDIGSNDGTLLSKYKDRGLNVIGIEPTDVADVANKNGIPTLKRFFNKITASRIMQKASLITCCNCFAHMPEPNEIVEAIKMLLKPGGTFLSESHYLMGLLDTCQYDTIYHEHLRYYSVTSLQHLFDRHGFLIDAVKKIPTHGSSIRVYASMKSVLNASEVYDFTESEKYAIDGGHAYHMFKEQVLRSRRDLVFTVQQLKGLGRVVGVGAPSRASVVINYCRLDIDQIDYVVERTGSLKIGRYMPGTRIPVVDEQRLIDEQPEAAIVFSWHIFDEIEKNLRAKGYKGKLVKPI